VISYIKSSIQAQMIDVDALIKNPERGNKISRIFLKNQENHQKIG
jgi:hypothetical protein